MRSWRAGLPGHASHECALAVLGVTTALRFRRGAVLVLGLQLIAGTAKPPRPACWQCQRRCDPFAAPAQSSLIAASEGRCVLATSLLAQRSLEDLLVGRTLCTHVLKAHYAEFPRVSVVQDVAWVEGPVLRRQPRPRVGVPCVEVCQKHANFSANLLKLHLVALITPVEHLHVRAQGLAIQHPRDQQVIQVITALVQRNDAVGKGQVRVVQQPREAPCKRFTALCLGGQV
mmetsp:Transcript_54775/g.127523  ORF Transcript_54775/g.127523 Transcript_54775/m.127523 type:complete len:230 (-) Transcript_54775:11-700(-)